MRACVKIAVLIAESKNTFNLKIVVGWESKFYQPRTLHAYYKYYKNFPSYDLRLGLTYIDGEQPEREQ